MNSLKFKLDSLNKKLDRIENDIETPEDKQKRHTGVAFVVFSTRNNMSSIVDNFKVSNLE